jgi:hypothetical protein
MHTRSGRNHSLVENQKTNKEKIQDSYSKQCLALFNRVLNSYTYIFSNKNHILMFY